MAALVVLDHAAQAQAGHLRRIEAQADDAAAVADQLRHHRHIDQLGRGDQVGLVLALGIVADQHRPAPSQGGQRVAHPLGSRGAGRGFVGRMKSRIHETLQVRVEGAFQGKRRRRDLAAAAATWSSFIRTVTVGSGIAPDLLTPRACRPRGARGLELIAPTAGGEFHPALKTPRC